MEIVKPVPGVRAVIANPPTSVPIVELHVAPGIVTVSSAVKRILDPMVTAVVFTSALVAPTAIATAPDGADPQSAGEAELEQFETVPNAATDNGTGIDTE